jgi:hypothetical protein
MTDMELRRLIRRAIAPTAGLADQLEAIGGAATVPDGKVLLLSCIDYRYPQLILKAMDDEGLTGHYYHMALAGASLAANTSGFGREAFERHLDFAVCEGGVTRVLILDHMDCAAYRRPLPAVTPGPGDQVACPAMPAPDNFPRFDFAAERPLHVAQLRTAVERIVRRHTQLTGHVTAHLMPAALGVEEIVRG